jgi:hypothetical protein
MRETLKAALVSLDQEARVAGRPDLVEHVEGVRLILASICQQLDAAREKTDVDNSNAQCR